MIAKTGHNLTAPLLPQPFAYIVCYELSNDVSMYEAFGKELTRSVKWMHYLPNVWFIMRLETLVELHRILVSKVYTTDKLLIMPATGPVTGLMPNDAWNWLNENLPRLW